MTLEEVEPQCEETRKRKGDECKEETKVQR